MTALQDPQPKADESLEVWLVWSDRRFTVAPGENLLSALQAAGVPIEPGCLAGSCGECATPYVEGTITHRDAYLTIQERENTFCPCVSRPQGTLVLPF